MERRKTTPACHVLSVILVAGLFLFAGHVRAADARPNVVFVLVDDLAVDISESNNLADSRPQGRDRLLAELHRWKSEVGASAVPQVKK